MGLIVKLPKKETYPTATIGEVSPLYHSQAVFSKIIQERLTKALEQHTREEQAGKEILQ